MTWYHAYLACFVLGLTFIGISALMGQFGGDHDGDVSGDGGDMADGVEGVHLPLFSPTVLSVFVGMFGAGGLILTKGLGIEKLLLHVGGSAAISLGSGVGVAFLMAKLMRHTETNTVASHSELVGSDVEVVLAIRGNEYGEIAYVAGGARHTMSARSEGGESFAQGDRARVIAVVGGVAHVAPPGARPALVSMVSGEGVPLALDGSRTKERG